MVNLSFPLLPVSSHSLQALPPRPPREPIHAEPFALESLRRHEEEQEKLRMKLEEERRKEEEGRRFRAAQVPPTNREK